MKKNYTLLIITLFAFLNPHSSFGQDWIWLNGDPSLVNNPAVSNSGFDSLNTPGGTPKSPILFRDTSGNIWLFGGSNSLNSIWEFDKNLLQWRQVQNSAPWSQAAMGQFDSTVRPLPGDQDYFAGCTDSTGKFWLFELNGFWLFDPEIEQWAWIDWENGNPWSFGTLGVEAPSNKPYGRRNAEVIQDPNSGYIYLFGGDILQTNGQGGNHNDLWRYNLTNNQWTWLGGALGGPAVLGNYSIPAIENSIVYPAGRAHHNLASDSEGYIYLFGGFGRKSTGFQPAWGGHNDLWRYNTINNQWTLLAGDSIERASSNSGLGVFSSNNIPPADNYYSIHDNAISYHDNALWLVTRTEIWSFDLTLNQWALMKTLDPLFVPSNPGIGTLNSSPSSNKTVYAFSEGNMAVYGSYFGGRNDMWELDIECGSFEVTQTINNISCNGSDDASIIFSLQGESPPFQFSINESGYTLDSMIYDLQPGKYQSRFINSKGCERIIDDSFEITEPPPLILSSSLQNDITCNNDNDALIQGLASGGTGSLTYSIDSTNFQSSTNFSNLSEGIYYLTVKDQNGCDSTASPITITNPPPIGVSGNLDQQITCFNQNNGQITVNANGGTGSLTYSINNSNYFSNNTFSNLSGGNYQLYVRDSKSCQGQSSTAFTINNPPAVQVNASLDNDITCNNDNNAQITASGSGGRTGLLYSIDNSTFTPNQVFNNLTAGNYFVYVKDSFNCSSSFGSIQITNPAPVNVSIFKNQDITCFNDNDGQITATASGGRGNLTYSLNGGGFSSNNVFNNLSGGTYSIRVRDINNCETTSSNMNVVNPPAVVASSNLISNITCNNANDGVIEVTGTGGVGGFTYNINGSNYGTNNSFANLASGSYTLGVRDANQCSSDGPPVSVSNPPDITANATITNTISCFGSNDGSIQVTASGGTGSKTYSIDGINFQSNPNFTNLGPATYIISVRDNNSCIGVASAVNLSNPSPISVSTSIDQAISCNGFSNGQISGSAFGGDGTYFYSLNNQSFQNNNSFNNLGAGSYKIFVKDGKNCKDSSGFVSLSNPPSLNAPSITVTSITCNNASNGQILANGTGGTGLLQYGLNGSGFSPNGNFSGLNAGTYTVTVRDANNCEVFSSAQTLINPSPVSVNTSISQAITCFGLNDGAIQATAFGGNGGFTYSLDNSTFSPTSSFNNLSSGTYTVYVNDANNCLGTSTPLTLNNPQALSVSSNITSGISCFNTTDGEITASVGGGTGTIQYSLDGNTFQIPASFTNLGPGNYTITARDGNNCQNQASPLTLTAPPVITINSNLLDSISCNNANDAEISSIALGGTGIISYSLNGGNYSPGGFFNNLGPGTYIVTARDANLCTVADNPIVVSNPPSLLATATINQAVSCYNGNDGSIQGFASGGSGNLFYSLDGMNFQPNSVFSGLSAGPYQIIVQDINQCVDSSGTITLQNPAELITTGVITQVVSCNNGSDGILTASATGGTGSVDYRINGGNFQSLNSFSSLQAGNYILEAEDANGCLSAGGTYTFNNPSAINVSGLVVKDISCFNGNDGNISITANGGTGVFTYSVDNQNYQASPVILNLQGGSYSVYAKDGNDCVDSAQNIIMVDPKVIAPEICLVTVDDLSTGNIVVWEKPITTLIDSFIIFREVVNSYIAIGGVSNRDTSYYLDNGFGVNPNAFAHAYKIQSVDTCGNFSDTSANHRTINVQTSLSPQGEINLDWDAYEGFAFPGYVINRSVNGNPYQAIQTVGASVLGYVDQNPPTGNLNYYVSVEKPVPCVADKLGRTFNRSTSNRQGQVITVLDKSVLDAGMEIYPNPVKDDLNIKLMKEEEVMSVQLFDALGNTIIFEEIGYALDSYQLNLKELVQGWYVLQVKTKNEMYTKTLIR